MEATRTLPGSVQALSLAARLRLREGVHSRRAGKGARLVDAPLGRQTKYELQVFAHLEHLTRSYA